ncbi:hypothetical protein [Reichenbachiella ulvae]|uniref:Polyketide cyclase / dehydrase and lipid transport n=1 Tax=Reichenbachiella ulvae TaxID=2980104 RepID=A0ABT3CZL2_9BACT|nr:hypothetical protein [Reichenbachiella ulvae]MCV9388954.1 hypothetical protein [Reichenbachiella ulvae]
MLLQVSNYSKEVDQLINDTVGKPFGFMDRIKMRGIGSQKLVIEEANEEIELLIGDRSFQRHVNIELRPKGIIIWFRVKLDSWVLALPYYRLTIYKSPGHLSLFAEQWRLKMIPAYYAEMNQNFIHKLLELKSESALSYAAHDPRD